VHRNYQSRLGILVGTTVLLKVLLTTELFEYVSRIFSGIRISNKNYEVLLKIRTLQVIFGTVSYACADRLSLSL
jgi:hypothetical protein